MKISVLRTALKRFSEQQMTDVAAALTYYALMSLLPMLVTATSVFALAGDSGTVARFVDYIAEHGADKTTAEAISELMNNIVRSSGGAAGIALAASLAVSLNGASGAFGAAGRALNRIEDLEEDRGFVRRKLNDIAMSVVIAALMLVVLCALFLGGDVAHDLFAEIGLGDLAADIWSVARWALALLGAVTAYALVYSFAPDREPTRLRLFTAGTVTGVLVWIVGSAAFAIYVRNFGSYGAAYGVFGATVVLLLWLYLSSAAFLLGAQIDHAVRHPRDPGRGRLRREKLPRK